MIIYLIYLGWICAYIFIYLLDRDETEVEKIIFYILIHLSKCYY